MDENDDPLDELYLYVRRLWTKTTSMDESLCCHLCNSPPSINVTLINVNSLYYLLTELYSPRIAN